MTVRHISNHNIPTKLCHSRLGMFECIYMSVPNSYCIFDWDHQYEYLEIVINQKEKYKIIKCYWVDELNYEFEPYNSNKKLHFE